MNSSIKVGDQVYFQKWKKEAIVCEINQKKKEARIQFLHSALYTSVKISELIRQKKPVNVNKRQENTVQIIVNKKQNDTIDTRLDLHGYTVQDALDAIDSAINRAYLRNESRLEVIHGDGTGRVRNAVRDYLAGMELVRNYEFAHPSLGGTGVTIVYLDQ